MLQKKDMILLYVKEYQSDSKKKRNNISKITAYEERFERLRQVLRRAKAHRVSTIALEEYHRQLRNLSYFAYRRKNTRYIRQINEELIPNLVRLDMEFVLPEDQENMGEDFLEYLEKDVQGEICTRSLFAIFHEYRQYAIKSKILELVPSKPETEFPEALKMRRHFILHVGPTNSGKTFQALERLKEAKNGVYLGPLRLLALEVYEKMKEYGTPCTMLTGEECIEDKNARVTASTVEMLDIEQVYDIAVIDEAQMAADTERGHSWTRAILGIQAHEIHICMSPAARQVVEHLIGLCKDDYEVREYERKTVLKCEEQPFVLPDDVRSGDALIVFSKRSVLDIAGRLEENGIMASVIYGSLPPEIRRRQTSLFTSGKTKVVVSTDAIGMGLNLPVKRIVFIQMSKFDGTRRRHLDISEIKQIAGRAGRYGIYNVGYINAFGAEELEYVRERFEAAEEPVRTVSLGFPQVLLNLEESMDIILKLWHSISPSEPFEKVSIEETLFLYEQAYQRRESIEGFENKHILYKMITCPIDIKDVCVVEQWLGYCQCYNADISLPHPVLENCGPPGIIRYETYYKELDLYYQFSHRMGKVIDEKWLGRERGKTEGIIMQFLTKGKEAYIATCGYCGRVLPIGATYRYCDQCKRLKLNRKWHRS